MTRSSLRPRLQTEARYAEGAVLVVHGRIEGVEARFRDTPGHRQLPTVGNLVFDRGTAAAFEQAVGIVPYQQARHEILKHRGAPGEQCGGTIAGPCQWAPEIEPVALRHVLFGNRHQAGEARLRGE